jgi:membrane-associated phospholipid phosphatase
MDYYEATMTQDDSPEPLPRHPEATAPAIRGEGEPLQSSVEPEMAELLVSDRRAAIRARWGEWAFGVALILYTVLAVLAHRYAYFHWDVTLAQEVQSINTPGFGRLMIFLSALGSGWLPIALVVSVGTVLILNKLKLEGVICISAAGLGAAMNSMLKLLIGRPRPPETLVHVVKHYAHDSFPSGHVTFYVEFFGFLLFLSYVLLRKGWFRRAALTLFGLLIGLVGFSRVYMGAHWPSDVAGAYLAGGIWLMLTIDIYRQRKARQRKPEMVN